MTCAAIEQAEADYAAGDVVAAQAQLAMVLDDPAAAAGDQVQALSDLAVIAWGEGRHEVAHWHLLSALQRDPGYVPALENLSAMCEAGGDLVQAAHWARRAAEAEPDVAAQWRRLAALLLQRRRFADAVSALERARDLGDDTSRELEEIRRRNDLGAPPARRTAIQVVRPAGRRVLIVVDWFHPSVGGSERLAEAAGCALQREGISVEVATRPLAARTERVHRGMTIREIGADPQASLQGLISEHRYDAILVFSAPTCWPVIASLRLPAPHPRLVVVPCINAEIDAALRSDPRVLSEYARLLASAEIVGYSSHSGPDVRLCEDLGVRGVYVPNASEPTLPAAASPTVALGADAPLLLMVANMWPEKNHLGLLRVLHAHDGDWRLAIIGDASPEFPHIAGEVVALAEADPRVRLLGRAGPDGVAAAMRDASILLLPSHAEATPLVLLEAMSRRLPWIATPTCGAAHDHAGGLILPLHLFGEGIDFLLTDRQAARSLGAAGSSHWEACYTWEVMGPRYARLLTGEAVGDLPVPSPAIADTESVRCAFYDARPAGAAVTARR